MRLIDADLLRDEILKCDNGCIDIDFNLVIDLIDNAPTVEQECYITGAQWNEYIKEHRKQIAALSEIRWTDKVSVNGNGDVIDFKGCIIGHINLDMLK